MTLNSQLVTTERFIKQENSWDHGIQHGGIRVFAKFGLFYHIDQISKIYIAWMQKKRNPIHLSLHFVRI